jgi:hypothetical protein
MDSNKTILKQEEKKFLDKKSKELNTQKKTSIKDKTNTKKNIFIKSEKYISIEREIEKIKKLDSNYYYNKLGKKFSLELYYVSNKIDVQLTSEYIKRKLLKK